MKCLRHLTKAGLLAWAVALLLVLVPNDRTVTADVPDLVWSTATLSQGRYGLAATTVGTKALFAGGYNGIFSNAVDIYDSQTGVWSTATLSRGRLYLAATTVGTKALFGGGDTAHGWAPTDRVDIYDAATDMWTTSALSQGRILLAATTVGSKALFAGGYTGTVFSNVVDIYDGTTGTWSTATLSQARYHLAATAVGTKALFAGGVGSDGAISAVVDIYDGTTGAWSTATLSQARYGPAAAAVGNKAFFAGGVGSDGAISNVVDIYDGTTGARSTATLSLARYALAAATVGTKALFAGGKGSDGAFANVVDIYDGTTGAWSTATLSLARFGLAATTVGTKALFGGGTTHTHFNWSDSTPNINWRDVVDIATIGTLDSDGDGVPDSADNCPNAANADQADLDVDRIGDVCDPENRVAIDIKPGSFPNSINPKSKGVIPVAVLTTDTFNAADIDPNTVRFGRTGTEAAAARSALEDVDLDGDTDMVLHFNTAKAGIQCGDASASLAGETIDGLMIEGSDSIKTAGCK